MKCFANTFKGYQPLTIFTKHFIEIFAKNLNLSCLIRSCIRLCFCCIILKNVGTKKNTDLSQVLELFHSKDLSNICSCKFNFSPLISLHQFSSVRFIFPAGICLKSTMKHQTMLKICEKFTVNTTERHRSGVFQRFRADAHIIWCFYC